MATNTIQSLMQRPVVNHDVAWLQNALQAGIKLELATLPPYLSALFSIADQTSATFNLINDIVFNGSFGTSKQTKQPQNICEGLAGPK